MSQRSNPDALLCGTRRQLLASVPLAVGSLAVASELWGQAQAPAMQETPGTAANHTRTSLHQENSFAASPQRIYDILLDSRQFAAFTGG